MRLDARHDAGAEAARRSSDAVARLQRDFGGWQVPWGEINRFQRISPAIDHPFSDAAPSIPVAVRLGALGLARLVRRGPKPGTKKLVRHQRQQLRRGRRVREARPRPRGHRGGESGNPASPHFNDQAQRYASGNLREVYFYPDQLKGHTERRYRPGE